MRRLMPRLVLAAHTIGTRVAASRTARSSAPWSPVVPITSGVPSRAASAACSAVAAGVVNSIATALSRNSCSRLSPTAIPIWPIAASSPISWPIAALPGRATPPAKAQPSAATMSAISMRPTRPAHPITPILVSAMPASLNPVQFHRDCFVAGLCAMTIVQLSLRAKRSNPDPAMAPLDDDFPNAAFPLHRGRMALLRSVATVGSYTLVSRVFGFIRDILTAAILGAGPVADAFFVAQRLPNLFRSLFAEGAFSAAFVPLASGALAEGGKPALREFAEEAFAVLFAVLLAFVLIGEIFMPEVMAVIAPGCGADPGKFTLTVGLTRITFPYLLFISLTALQGGILNSVERFAATAATPMLLNIFLIAALVFVRPISGVAL